MRERKGARGLLQLASLRYRKAKRLGSVEIDQTHRATVKVFHHFYMRLNLVKGGG
jgi:hypothetical protein